MFDRIKKFFKIEASDTAICQDLATDIVPFERRMLKLEEYFRRQSATDGRFQPEFEASSAINKIALKEELSENDLKEVVQIFNDTNLQPHYNGSGWFDLKIHIHNLVLKQGLRYEDLPNGNIELL